MKDNMLNKLFMPDGKMLTSMVVGKPGAGKSYWLNKSLEKFCKSYKDENFRLVFICPKNEMVMGDKKNNPITVDKLEKHLQKNRIAVVYTDPEYVEQEVDYAIDLVFGIQQVNPDFNCLFCVDDAQTFISSRKQASPQFRRLALTGRSKGIRFLAVSHQMVFSKDLEGSTSYIVNFSLPVKLYHKDAQTRYGFDVTPFIEPLQDKEYSFVVFDVTKSKGTLYEPIA
tara:strand:+ start:711 stop:1388 length:678 start_codon:yes stop_codon:yes gene_type:complete